MAIFQRPIAHFYETGHSSLWGLNRRSFTQEHDKTRQARDADLSVDAGATLRISGSGFSTLSYHRRRTRRSPCLDDLLTACRGSRSGASVIADLVRNNGPFFSSSDNSQGTLTLRLKADVNKILSQGIFHGPLGEADEKPGILQDLTEQERNQFLLGARADALRDLGTAPRIPIASSTGSLASTSENISEDLFADLEIEIDWDLTERLTGYPFEKPADIIREQGALLINSRLVHQSQLQAVVTRASVKPVFLGPWIPAKSIRGILHNGKYIWRRPVEAPEDVAESAERGSRYERILNVAINPDEQVTLAQRYLSRKHSAITDNYTLQQSGIEAIPRLERLGPQPELRPLPSRIRLNIAGTGNASSPFGENMAFDQLCQNLVGLVYKRRLQGEIGIESALSLDFIGCGFLSRKHIQHLQAVFRNQGLSVPTVDQRAAPDEGAREPADLDFVISLSSEQFTVGTVSQLQGLHPTAVVYNMQSRPNVRTPGAYRQIPRTAPMPAKHLRINVIGHGEGTDGLGGISLSSLAGTLATRIRGGQVAGEFHVKAKVTINFVACKVSPTSLAALYHAFQRKKIQLSGVHFRNTELLVDSAGRKLQRQNNGEWRHAHHKRVFVFNSAGQPTEMPPLPIPDPPDPIALRDAAGPLLAKAEGQYHVQQLGGALDSLKRENSLTAEWRPDLGSLTKIGEKRYEIKFRKNQEVVTIATDKSSLAEFDAFSKAHAEVVGRRYRFEGGALKPVEEVAGGGLSEAAWISRSNRMLSGLSAIRMLVGVDQSLQSSYTDEIRAHTLVNLAQSVHVLGNETVDLAGSMRSLLVEKTAFTEVEGGLTAARFLRGVNRMAGRGLVVASVGFDIYELTQARTPEEKLRSGLMLGLDGAFVGLEVAAMAGVAAAGPLALLLGLGLLAFEFGEWIYKQHVAHHNEETVYRYFENLRRAYFENTVEYDANRDVLRFAPGAVITSVVLDEQPGVELDSQKLRITKVVSCSSGDERSSLAMATVFRVTGRSLNIRSEMGWPDKKSIPSAAVLASNLLLPVSPKANLHYSYRSPDANDQLRRSEGARILQRLAQSEADLQLRACTKVIGSITPAPQETQIKVRLGLRDRVLLMPPDLPKEVAQCLKYPLEGGGGNYKLFPARHAEFTLREAAQNTPPSNWIVDLSSLEELDDLNYTVTADVLTFHDAVKGDVKINIGGVRGSVEVHSKLRKWRFDRNSNQLRLTDMDFAINELPNSRGARLRSEINRKLGHLSATRAANQTSADRNPIADALAAAFQNQNIPISDYLHFEAFSLGSTPSQTVVCDVGNKVLISAGSDKLPNAKFVGRVGSSFYFSMGRMFWKGSLGLDQPSSREQMLFFDQARNHRINLWQENGITFLSQVVPLNAGNRLEAIYQLNDDEVPSLIKLIIPARPARTPAADFRQRIRFDQPVSASAAFRVIEEIATAPRTLLPSALITTATKSNLILLISRDQQGGEQRFWLDMTHNELVFLDESLPTDAIPVAKTNSGIFFYSDSAKKLFRRMNSSARSVLLMEGVRSLKLVEGQLQAEANEGMIYQFNGEGKKRLIAVGARWVEAHQTTLTDDIVQLALNQETAESIAIQGLKLANGQTFFCWYDPSQNQYTLASNQLTNEKLLHLGAGVLEGGAWLFQPESGQLYQAPTFTSQWMKLLMSHPGKVLPVTAELAESKPILAHEKFENVTRLQDGPLIGRTQSGLLLKLEMPRRPLVLAVNQAWMAQETHQERQLALLAQEENFQSHWNIDLPATASPSCLSWYDVRARKIITVLEKNLTGSLDYVGYNSTSNTAYFGNPTKLIAIPASGANQQPSETRFQNPDRDQNIFSLQVKANTSRQSSLPPPPALAGVDTLLLHGSMDGLAINQELWDHHWLILLSRISASPEGSREFDQIDLQFSGAENLMLKRLGNDLVLELPSQPASTRLMFKDFFVAGRIWNLTIRLPNESQRKIRSQELLLQANETKPLAAVTQ